MLKVGILNNYLQTFGGGERLCYALANALASLGYAVDVFTFEDKVPSQQQIDAAFGPGHSGFSVISLAGDPERDPEAVLAERLKDYTLFVNHTAGNAFRNPCPLGVYLVMFPFQGPGPFLDTYDHYLCISEFTAFYTRALWRPGLEISVLYPSASPAPGGFQPARERTREIVSVGRFNVHGHNKNQAPIVEAFKRAPGLIRAGWQLTLVGRINPGAETAAYVRTMVEECRDLPVRFEFNASEHTKQEILHRAGMYWSATGLGLSEPRDAARMEHFGIAVVEGMLAGAIPLCVRQAGPREIIQDGVNGFLYEDVEELGTYAELIALRPRIQQRMHQAAIERARHFSRAKFDADVARFFKAIVAA
jgi:glycosyltransferase involved in cell wall biosynthesis